MYYMCIYTYIAICIYIYVYIDTYIHMYISIHMFIKNVCAHIYTYTCIYMTGMLCCMAQIGRTL